MHPEMTRHLTEQHRRELTADGQRAHLAAAARRAARPGQTASRPLAAPVRAVRWPVSRALVPRYRLTWTRTTLALADSAQRQRSWVIVISATRARARWTRPAPPVR